jgi:hypothetical protein
VPSKGLHGLQLVPDLPVLPAVVLERSGDAHAGDTSVHYARRGTEAIRASRWREAEWWFTRIAWTWPGYAAAHLDIAATLEQRLAAGFDATVESLHGDLDEARRCLAECQRRDPADRATQLLARRLATMSEGGPRPRTLHELERWTG